MQVKPFVIFVSKVIRVTEPATMKYLITIILIFSLMASAKAANLTITVTNIKETKGSIVIGIFNNKESFPKNGRETKQLFIAADADEVTKTITGLPDGEYAIAIYHDKNSDGVCNKNILGIPQEGFGFSNNFKPRLKSPAFADVKFNVKENAHILIKLLYF